MNRLPFWCYALTALAIGELILYVVALNTMPANGSIWRVGKEDLLITHVVPGSPEEDAGLRAGDTLKAVGGATPEAWFVWKSSWTIPAGTPVDYTVSRGDSTFVTQVMTRSLWDDASGFQTAYYLSLFLIVALGVFVLLKRRTEPAAQLLFALSQLYAVSLNYLIVLGDPLSTLRVAIFLATATFVAPVVFHFFILFPRPQWTPQTRLRLLLLVYALGVFVALIVVVPLLQFAADRTAENALRFRNAIALGRYWMGTTAVLVILFSLYRFVSDREAVWARLRWVTIGTVIGMSTWVIHGFFYEDVVFPLERLIPNLNQVIGLLCGVALLASYSYALFRHRLWDIEIVVKRGLLYGGVTVAVVATYILVVFLAGLILQPGGTGASVIGIAGSALAFIPVREVLQRRIDRMFHREVYEPGKVVIDFEERLAGIYDTAELHREILAGIDGILHFKSLLLLLKNGDGVLMPAAGVDRLSEEASKPIHLTLEDEHYLISNKALSLAGFATHRLAGKFLHLQAELLFPVVYKRELQGVLVCGGKKSEREYSLQDVQLLQLLAQRSATLLKLADLYRMELERQLTLERERTRISRDMHDELGANLTSLSMLTEIARRSLSDPAEVDGQLRKAGTIALDTVRKLDEIVWAVNPKADSLANLAAYISEFAQEFFSTTSVRIRFDFPDRIPDLPLASDVRHNIFLVVKEALNNVIKHAAATEACIRLSAVEGTIVIEVTDNGKGCCAATESGFGNGIRNMRQRIESIGGWMDIGPGTEGGTRIRLGLPLPGA